MLLIAFDALEVRPLFRSHGSVQLHLHDVGVSADGIERREQLVGHVAEERGLRPIRRVGRLAELIGLGEQAGMVQRDRAALGELRRQSDLVVGQRRIAFSRDKRDCAEAPVTDEERNDQQSAEAELAEQLEVIRSVGCDDERGGRTLGDDPRLPFGKPRRV